jgi:hypothetical protein
MKVCSIVLKVLRGDFESSEEGRFRPLPSRLIPEPLWAMKEQLPWAHNASASVVSFEVKNAVRKGGWRFSKI